MVPSNWQPVRARSLVPGDAVRWTLPKSTVEVVARVVDVVRDRRNFMAIVERTGVVGDAASVALPPVVSRIGAEILDLPSSRLHRHSKEGAAVKADGPGRSYLLSLLQEAAGGDAANRLAVDKVAGCVLAADLEAAAAEGRLPRRMGRTVATGMLAGRVVYGEAVHRQLTGRLDVGETVAPVEPRDAAAEQFNLLKKAQEPQVDPEVAAISAAFPGARVVEVRTRDVGSGR